MKKIECLPCGVIPQVVDSKVAYVTFGVDDPDQGAEATGSFAYAHVANELRGVNSQLFIVKDHGSHNGRRDD